MSATLPSLIRMANQIAANLAHDPDPAGATFDHIRRFWDPRMRQLVLDAPADAFTPVASAAIDRLRKA